MFQQLAELGRVDGFNQVLVEPRVEGVARPELFGKMGQTPEAFSFRQPFPAPDGVIQPNPVLDRCA